MQVLSFDSAACIRSKNPSWNCGTVHFCSKSDGEGVGFIQPAGFFSTSLVSAGRFFSELGPLHDFFLCLRVGGEDVVLSQSYF